MAKKVDFECPICGYNEYIEFSGSFKSCRNCSVVFLDPEKFNAKMMIYYQPKEKISAAI